MTLAEMVNRIRTAETLDAAEVLVREVQMGILTKDWNLAAYLECREALLQHWQDEIERRYENDEGGY